MARRDTNGHANGSGGGASARSMPNASFARTPFLDGGNAAYIEQLQDRYLNAIRPRSTLPGGNFSRNWKTTVPPSQRRRRASLEAARLARRGHRRPGFRARWQLGGRSRRGSAPSSRRKPAKRVRFRQEDLLRATRDSVHALMMIRAYRMRGHLHANLDPLGLEAPKDHEELHPATYGFSEADYSRKIFIDGVLGLQYATVPEMLKILRRTYCGTIGFEFMHISDPAEKSWLQQRIEGPGKEITFTKEGKRAILTKLVELEGFEKFLDVKYTGTKRFGLDGGRSHGRGARTDHQARRRLGGPGHRPRHGAPGPPQYPVPGHGETAPGDFQ